MKKVVLIALTLAVFALSGCLEATQDADSKQAEQTKTAMKEANSQIGMPNIVNFQQRKLMRDILELCDKENLICYAYTKSDYTGKLQFLGKCIGYGIPFSAQFTNPERIAFSSSSGRISLPQADPNGLFMPPASSATWLMMIDPKTGKPRPVYVEAEIAVSPFPLH